MLRGVIFNFLIGNGDAHGKNFSLLYKDEAVELAPFYDLLCTLHYGNAYKAKMAMKLGGKYNFKTVKVHHPIIQAGGMPSIFDDHSDVGHVIATLEENGYAVSQNKLQRGLPFEGLYFKPKGKGTKPMTGRELLKALNAEATKLTGTYWLHDQNTAAQMPEFARIAFDPYILSVVSGYLGCTPIHVQTCLWFSFAGQQNQQTLSRNAQFFHQEKEFVKFIKVFIYLNDVTTENGPHCYIESSHKDELNKYSIPYSKRVTDEEVISLYGAERLKVLEGKAGTIIFGDTVSAHKGMPLKQGGRLMLQLEYAASLVRFKANVRVCPKRY